MQTYQWHDTTPHRTASHHTALHARHDTALHNTAPHYTTWHRTTRQDTILHYRTGHRTAPHRTTLHYTTRHCITQHRTALHDMTPHDKTRHDTALHDRTPHRITRHDTAQQDKTRHDTALHDRTPTRHDRLGKGRAGQDKMTRNTRQDNTKWCHTWMFQIIWTRLLPRLGVQPSWLVWWPERHKWMKYHGEDWTSIESSGYKCISLFVRVPVFTGITFKNPAKVRGCTINSGLA